jgi:hypothetical protein
MMLRTSGNRGRVISVPRRRDPSIVGSVRKMGDHLTNYVGLDVSQKTTTLCIVDGEGHRQWRGECITSPDQIVHTVLRHAGLKNRSDPADRMILRHCLIETKRIEKLCLLAIEPPHHGPLRSRIAS